MPLLDTRETEGGGDWSGHLVGTSFNFSHRGELDTLEGDPRFYFDDSLTPQAQGTYLSCLRNDLVPGPVTASILLGCYMADQPFRPLTRLH
jgi:hypothetical protein